MIRDGFGHFHGFIIVYAPLNWHNTYKMFVRCGPACVLCAVMLWELRGQKGLP